MEYMHIGTLTRLVGHKNKKMNTIQDDTNYNKKALFALDRNFTG